MSQKQEMGTRARPEATSISFPLQSAHKVFKECPEVCKGEQPDKRNARYPKKGGKIPQKDRKGQNGEEERKQM